MVILINYDEFLSGETSVEGLGEWINSGKDQIYRISQSFQSSNPTSERIANRIGNYRDVHVP